MNYRAIHEVGVSDIMNAISKGLDTIDRSVSSKNGRRNNVNTASSIGRAASGLTLVFPVICSSSLSYDSAQMVTKAVERKSVSLLRMLFAASSLSNVTDAYQYLTQFHTNLDFDKFTIDDILDDVVGQSLGSCLGESSINYMEDIELVKAIYEDCRRNINYFLEEDVNPVSLNNYNIIDIAGRPTIIKEERKTDPHDDYDSYSYTDHNGDTYFDRNQYRDDVDAYNRYINKQKEDKRQEEREQDRKDKAASEERRNQERVQDREDRARENEYRRKQDEWKAEVDNIKNQLVSNDIKKVNEMVPTLLQINFHTATDKNGHEINYTHSAIIGVKAKLYAVLANDVLTRLVSKAKGTNFFLNLVKASTREISFVKDLLLGIDDAKLNAIEKKKRGSSVDLFNALERRSLKGKIRKLMKKDSLHKSISTLVISQEEADLLRKYNHVDLEDPKVIGPIMEEMNLLYFMIVDESNEIVKMMFDDGSRRYETYTFSALERESDGKTAKQMLNLMAKMK